MLNEFPGLRQRTPPKASVDYLGETQTTLARTRDFAGTQFDLLPEMSGVQQR